VSEESVAEVRVFLSKTDDDEARFRAFAFVGPTIGPEEAGLERREFTGPSLDGAADSAFEWARQVLVQAAD